MITVQCVYLQSMHPTLAQLDEFLRARYPDVSDIKHIGSGWYSHAYRFSSDAGQQVLRLNGSRSDFEKDAFAWQHFNSSAIPVPAIREIGQFDDDLYFCISDYYEGPTADDYVDYADEASITQLVQRELQSMIYLHQLPADDYPGWGISDAEGQGRWRSWGAYLLHPVHRRYDIHWEELAAHGLLDGALFERLTARIKSLLPSLPEKKHFLHGDFGFDNLIVRDGKIVAVLDWAEMLLGDDLYDIVSMESPWQGPQQPYIATWKRMMDERGIAVPNFEERVTCYRIHRAMLEMHGLAARKEEGYYREVADWARLHL